MFRIQMEEKRKLLPIRSKWYLRFERFGILKNTLISPHLVNKELNLNSAPRDIVAPPTIMSSFGLCGIAERIYTGYRRRVSRKQAFRYGIRASVSGVAKIEFPTTESTVCIDISHIYKLILWCIVQDRRTLLKVRLFTPPWKHFVPCKFLSDLRLSAVERHSFYPLLLSCSLGLRFPSL